MYDLVVIGLGPAGSFAVKTASTEGISVLAIEKRKTIGVPVECGEFVPGREEIPTLMPQVEDWNLLEIPDEFVANKTTQTALITPSGAAYITPFQGRVLKRDKWLQHVVAEAERAGAEIWTESKVMGLRGDEVQIQKGNEAVKVRARVIIGADGTASRVARWGGFPQLIDAQNLCPVQQHRMRDVEIDPQRVEMYLGRAYAPGAYAWIIPRDNQEANVGIGFRRDYVQPGDTRARVFTRFLTEHPVARERLRQATIESTITGLVPVARPAARPGDTVRGRVMLVGDSARQTIAFVGAGIPPGIIVGTIAGRIAAEHIQQGVPLTKYEREWKIQLLDALERGYWLKVLWDRLASITSEHTIDWFFNRLSAKNLATILRNKIPWKLRIGKHLMFLLEHIV